MKAIGLIARTGCSAAMVGILALLAINQAQCAELATQPMSEDFAAAGPLPRLPSSGCLTRSPQECGTLGTAPNMIGDQFGGGTASLFRTSTEHFAGTLRQSANGLPQTFQSNSHFVIVPPLPIQYVFDPQIRYGAIGPFTVVKNGVPLTLSDGSNWMIVNTDSFVPVAPLAENPDETAAVRQAFPDATEVQFVSGQATSLVVTRFGQFYNIDTDYLLTFRTAIAVNLPNPANGGAVGRIKIAENNSALPQDRLLFDFNHFHHVPLATGVNVQRFTPGFEKTLLDGQASIEMRVPMAVTLDDTVVPDGGTDLSNGEFGDLRITPKLLLFRGPKSAVCMGMTITAPTADDSRAVLADGTDLVQISNETVALGPFLGGLWTPNNRVFLQGFLQYEVDPSGSPVYVNRNLTGLEPAGRLHGTTYQYVDVGAGWWACRNPSEYNLVQGVALIGELHWTRSLEAGDFVQSGDFLVGDLRRDVQLLDLTLGLHMDLRNRTTATVGYSVPVGNSGDHQFEGEFRLMLNRFFGP